MADNTVLRMVLNIVVAGILLEMLTRAEIIHLNTRPQLIITAVGIFSLVVILDTIIHKVTGGDEDV